MPTLGLGPLHHVSIAVPDVEAAARVYEESLGWSRLVDVEVDGIRADQIADLIGVPRLDSFRGIMVQAPGSLLGMIELVELRVTGTSGDPATKSPLGPLVLSYVVPELDAAIAGLVGDGFELVGGPHELNLGGRLRAASLRGPHALPIELIEFLGR